MILHHYQMSPFSEKIRAMLGYTGIAWQSVRVREFPPRPKLDALTGGYRKIPVAQIGADVFCDSRTISTEIARLANKPELALENVDQQVQEFVAQTDLEIFLACVMCVNTGVLARKVRKQASLLHLARLLWDRINMGRKARVAAAKPKQAKGIVHGQAQRIEKMLDRDFLFGDSPNIADFAAYHGLWFIRDMSESEMLTGYPKLNAWMDRIKAFGNGAITEISADEALAQAKQTDPRALPTHMQNDTDIGHMVTIGPNDYGRDRVRGELLAVTGTGYIIAREQARCGRVHVHFPKQGFICNA